MLNYRLIVFSFIFSISFLGRSFAYDFKVNADKAGVKGVSYTTGTLYEVENVEGLYLAKCSNPIDFSQIEMGKKLVCLNIDGTKEDRGVLVNPDLVPIDSLEIIGKNKYGFKINPSINNDGQFIVALLSANMIPTKNILALLDNKKLITINVHNELDLKNIEIVATHAGEYQLDNNYSYGDMIGKGQAAFKDFISAANLLKIKTTGRKFMEAFGTSEPAAKDQMVKVYVKKIVLKDKILPNIAISFFPTKLIGSESGLNYLSKKNMAPKPNTLFIHTQGHQLEDDQMDEIDQSMIYLTRDHINMGDNKFLRLRSEEDKTMASGLMSWRTKYKFSNRDTQK